MKKFIEEIIDSVHQSKPSGDKNATKMKISQCYQKNLQKLHFRTKLILFEKQYG